MGSICRSDDKFDVEGCFPADSIGGRRPLSSAAPGGYLPRGTPRARASVSSNALGEKGFPNTGHPENLEGSPLVP